MTTVVHIDRDRFHINGRPTYEGLDHHGLPVEGLLFNARLVPNVAAAVRAAAEATGVARVGAGAAS